MKSYLCSCNWVLRVYIGKALFCLNWIHSLDHIGKNMQVCKENLWKSSYWFNYMIKFLLAQTNIFWQRGTMVLLCYIYFAATTLTSWHLIVTFCTLHVAQRLNFFETKSADMKTVVLFGVLNGVSIGLLNLSLGFNSVGFYQMTKLAIIPFTVLLETLFLSKQFRLHIRLSYSMI